MKTFYSFRDVRAFQGFFHSKEWKEGELDYVTIGKKVFTLHEYDMDGRYMPWGHKASDTIIECETANRYKSWKDAKLYRFPHCGMLREDINFAQ